MDASRVEHPKGHRTLKFIAPPPSKWAGTRAGQFQRFAFCDFRNEPVSIDALQSRIGEQWKHFFETDLPLFAKFNSELPTD